MGSMMISGHDEGTFHSIGERSFLRGKIESISVEEGICTIELGIAEQNIGFPGLQEKWIPENGKVFQFDLRDYTIFGYNTDHIRIQSIRKELDILSIDLFPTGKFNFTQN